MVHKHVLTMTRTLSKASGIFEFTDFCLSGMLVNIHEYLNLCHLFHFLLSNLSKILHVAVLLPVSIFYFIPFKLSISVKCSQVHGYGVV